jgi:hypothetical protein
MCSCYAPSRLGQSAGGSTPPGDARCHPDHMDASFLQVPCVALILTAASNKLITPPIPHRSPKCFPRNVRQDSHQATPFPLHRPDADEWPILFCYDAPRTGRPRLTLRSQLAVFLQKYPFVSVRALAQHFLANVLIIKQILRREL